MLAVSLLILVAFTQFIISLGILLESRRSKQVAPRLFVGLSFLTFLWTIANTLLIFVDTRGNASTQVFFDVLNRAAFTLGTLTLLATFVFNLYWPKAKIYGNKSKLLIALGFLLAIFASNNLVAGNFNVSNGGLAYTPGPLGVLLAAYSVAIIATIYATNTKLLATAKDRTMKVQVRNIMRGLNLTIIHAILFTILLPLLYPDKPVIYTIGYFAPYFYIIATIYGLLKQGLFDFRLIVARAVAYVFLLGTLASLFAAIVLGGSVLLLGGEQISVPQQLFYVSIVLILAVVFQPLKKFFDKTTNHIFYQDAYDSQVLLDEFNKVLVSTIELDVLLVRASAKIQEHIKSDYCVITVQKTEDASRHIEGTANRRFAEDDLQFLDKVTPEVAGVVIAVDLLGDEHQQLKQSLNKSNVSVISRLVNHAAEGDLDIGYIIFGPKKSGNLYSQQDLTLIEILSNELVIAVQNALRFEEIEKFNITLQEKIETATRRLQRNNEKLKAMDETKDEFISMASHQLRTPLTSVKGYLSMVLEGDAGELNAMQRKLLDQAFISSQRMVYLIADLLNVSRLHTGKFIIDAAPTSLADVIEGEAQQLEKTATGRGLVLSYKKPQNFPLLMLDETKIRQVVMNFLDNAIYYSKPGGHIEILLTHTDDSVEFKVVDDGIGVPKHEQPQLFNKFYRAGNAKKARPDGTGLGLFMAKKVVVAQGGSIVFKSEEGKGSTFGFVFGKQKLALPKTAQSKSAVTSK